MSLSKQAEIVARMLRETNTRVVFAESCTAGLASAMLATQPGISEFHCGGVNVYRNATKSAYLDIAPETLKQFGAVSSQVTEAMALSVLEKTPEANIAGAITGFLGPGDEASQDGQYFLSVAQHPGELQERDLVRVTTRACQCRLQGRIQRQQEVAEQVFVTLSNTLSRPRDAD